MSILLQRGVLKKENLHFADAILPQQGVLRKEHLLTLMAAVIGQRGSRTLLTGSDVGKFHVTFLSVGFL